MQECDSLRPPIVEKSYINNVYIYEGFCQYANMRLTQLLEVDGGY